MPIPQQAIDAGQAAFGKPTPPPAPAPAQGQAPPDAEYAAFLAQQLQKAGAVPGNPPNLGNTLSQQPSQNQGPPPDASMGAGYPPNASGSPDPNSMAAKSKALAGSM